MNESIDKCTGYVYMIIANNVKRGLPFYKCLSLTTCFQVSCVRKQHNLLCMWGYN